MADKFKIWDDAAGREKIVTATQAGAALTGAVIKSEYEAESDTNAFTDALAGKLSDITFPWAAKVTGSGPHTLAVATINRYDDSGGASMVLHLPAGPADMDEVEIKEVGGSANSVTVTTAAGTTSIEPISAGSPVTSDAVAALQAGVRYKWDATDSIWRIVKKVYV